MERRNVGTSCRYWDWELRPNSPAMNWHPKLPCWMLGLAIVLIVARCVAADANSPKSCCPVLDQAANSFAGSQFESANLGFDEVVQNSSNPAFVRGLALFGLAETARARLAAASQCWRRIADDSSLPAAYRDLAQRHLLESQLPPKRRAGWDASAHRESLPQLPKPGAVLYVAPGGSDLAPGTAAGPFATLARSRDAVRELKKSHGGSLPKGGVHIIISGGVFQTTEPIKLRPNTGIHRWPGRQRLEAGCRCSGAGEARPFDSGPGVRSGSESERHP